MDVRTFAQAHTALPLVPSPAVHQVSPPDGVVIANLHSAHVVLCRAVLRCERLAVPYRAAPPCMLLHFLPPPPLLLLLLPPC